MSTEQSTTSAASSKEQEASAPVPAISLQQVVKTYTGKTGVGGPGKQKGTETQAVKGISFDIHEGEFFGFLGPNGAGKTTTIKLITGLANITSGKIEVFGKDTVEHYTETRPMIGLAAQEPNFDPFFPLETVLTYQAGYHGLSREEAKARAEKLLKRFDLWEHRKKTPRQISGGMKRRLLIAKALVHDPKILILDEPTAGVDVELRRDMWRLLRELNEEGKTIVLTTHYIEEAEELCNRIGIINKGEIVKLEDKDVLMQQLAEKNVELVLEKEAGAELKADLLAIEGVNVNGADVCFPTENIEDYMKKVTDVIHKHNQVIVDVNTREFDLEDIFVQLTDMK